MTATKAGTDLPEKHSFFTWFRYAVRQSCQLRWDGPCPLSHVAGREHGGDWCCWEGPSDQMSKHPCSAFGRLCKRTGFSEGAVRSTGGEEAQGPLLLLSFFWIRRGGLCRVEVIYEEMYKYYNEKRK